MDEEGIQRTLGELLAANRAIQANFDKIRQQFPIQPGNLSDLIPDWAELEAGGLSPPGGEEPELFADGILPIEKQGDILVGDEDGNVGVLAVGKAGQKLTVDPSSPLGVKWAGESTEVPSGNEGEELTEELAEWVTVHDVQINEEEDNQPSLEFPYSPPANCDLAVFCIVCCDRAFSGSAKELTLDGQEADEVLVNSLEFEQCYVYVFKEPPSGNVVITNSGAGQLEYVCLPLSFKNQGGTPLERNGATSNAYQEGKDTSVTSALNIGSLPGVSIMMGARTVHVEAASPGATTSHSGTEVLNRLIKNDVKHYRVEVALQNVPAGTTERTFTWAETTSGFSSRFFTIGVREEPV